MEFILSLGKAILAVPISAIIGAPLISFSARIAKTAPVSLKAAVMLGLITGAVTLSISVVLYPLYWLIGSNAAEGLSLAACTAAAVWLFGYFLRDSAGNSIGIWRGLVVFAIQSLMLIGVIVLIGILIALMWAVIS